VPVSIVNLFHFVFALLFYTYHVVFRPCLFPGIHFPGNHFPHFSMFGKHKENWSKETQFPVNGKNKALGPESVFLSCF